MQIKTSEVGLSVDELEAKFYNKDFDFSYSSMNKLLGTPGVFYKEYILRQRDDVEAAHLKKGKIIHYLLLDNGLFDQKYIIAPDGIPTENTRIVVDRVHAHAEELAQNGTPINSDLSNYKDAILDVLVDMNLHQRLADDKKHPFKSGDDKRIEKIVTEQSKEYFKFLTTRGEREIIDTKELDECTLAVEAIKANKNIRELLGLDLEFADGNYGVYNELHHRVNTEYAFGVQGYLDNVVVDIQNKTVRINDVKTTSKSLTLFKESVEFWNYWLQAGIYLILVMDYLKEVINQDWSIEFRFIVVDKYNHVYPFKVSEETLIEWTKDTKEALKKANYHYENRDYSLPYEFIAGEVIL